MTLLVSHIKSLLRLQEEAIRESQNDAEIPLLFVDRVADYCARLSLQERKVVLFLLSTQFDLFRNSKGTAGAREETVEAVAA